MERYWSNHPNDPYVCNKLGALYVEMGELQHGVELLERGLKTSNLDPTLRYELHYHLGIANAHLRNPVLAIAHYRAAAEQPLPSKLKLGAYNNLGNLLKAQGDLTGALAAYDRVIKTDPTLAVGYYNRGLALRGQGDLSGAIAAYERAIALNPDYAAAHQNLGVARLKSGQVSESLDAFRQAIALYQIANPDEAKSLRNALLEMGLPIGPEAC
jgi:tetratricopeptide (TPR) repeat protein